MNYINKLCKHVDILQSLYSKKKLEPYKKGIIYTREKLHRRRKNLKKAAQRIRNKIKNMIEDCHNKFAKYLVQHFDYIILPKFNTNKNSKMISNLSHGNVRKMMTWSHGMFRDRLKNKIEENNNSYLFYVEEPYTSKYCGNCGTIHKDLGDSKDFICPKCKMEYDRDINASRNILLRF